MVALVSLIVSHFATVPVTRGSGSGCGSTAAMFVDDSGSAGPLAEALQVLDEFVAPSEPERLVVAGQHDYEVAAGRKILTENYHECYHCPSIHAALCQVSPPRSGENYVAPGGYVGGSMQLRDDMATMSLDGARHGVRLRGLDAVGLRSVSYVNVLRNLPISLHPAT